MYIYRKSMRQALEEARSYRDPVKEDKGYSSQQIKMAYGVLNDPRYKQGNYSGAFKAIEKIAKGLASHPDVANALKRANEELVSEQIEVRFQLPKNNHRRNTFKTQSDADKYADAIKKKGGVVDKVQPSSMSKNIDDVDQQIKLLNLGEVKNEELEEELKVKYDKTKQGWFDDKGRRRYLGNAATNAIMKKKLDHAIKTGDWTSFDVTKEEVEFNFLEEKFTKKDFDKNEDENDHSLNAIMLAKEFGTSQEIKDMEDIDKRHTQRGHINDPDYSKRNALVRKYHPRLK